MKYSFTMRITMFQTVHVEAETLEEAVPKVWERVDCVSPSLAALRLVDLSTSDNSATLERAQKLWSFPFGSLDEKYLKKDKERQKEIADEWSAVDGDGLDED